MGWGNGISNIKGSMEQQLKIISASALLGSVCARLSWHGQPMNANARVVCPALDQRAELPAGARGGCACSLGLYEQQGLYLEPSLVQKKILLLKIKRKFKYSGAGIVFKRKCLSPGVFVFAKKRFENGTCFPWQCFTDEQYG